MSQQPGSFYPDLGAAIHGTDAPGDIIQSLELVRVEFINFDSELRVGQIVVAKFLAEEVREIFDAIRDAGFPLQSVIPIAYFGHDDDRSIAANNTSAFNYRNVAGTDRLSRHSYGTAIDINPWLNPYVNLDGSLISPSNEDRTYEPSVAGTIVEGDPVVEAYDKFGWVWGGRWTEDHDYQHFDKVK